MTAEKTVRAHAPGYYVGPRATGDIFQVPQGLNGSWFKEVAPAAPAPAPAVVAPVKAAVLAVASKKATVGNDEELA